MAQRTQPLLLAAVWSMMFARPVTSESGVGPGFTSRNERLVVISLNTWHAGRGVEDGLRKIQSFLAEERADLVALQETEGDLARTLAASLGWWCAQSSGSVAVLSRHPIIEELRLDGEMESKAIGARVAVGDESLRVTIWSVHLQYEPYGPYDVAFAGLAREAIVQHEHEAGRVLETEAVLAAAALDLERALAGQGVLIVAGDWNAPSHLDWTASTAALHGGLVIPWPTSLAVERDGLRDTFREVNPDPATVPGTTWSPLYAIHEGSADLAEPQDRIDFVYTAGEVDTLRAETVVRGTPRPYPDQWSNEWPSDHAAVLTHLRLRAASEAPTAVDSPR